MSHGEEGPETPGADWVPMTRSPDLSIVVPTYNERERLADLVRETRSVFTDAGIAGEIVVVDDNSPDGTGAIADGLARMGDIGVVHRAGKLGLGSAVVEGFRVARSGILGVIDADLSHPPSALPPMLAAMRQMDVDMVVGSRYIPGGACRNWPLGRRMLSRLGCLLGSPLTPVVDLTSGLFLVRRSAIEGVRLSAAGFKICLELLVRGRVRSIAEVPYVFSDRAAGESKMTLHEAMNYFVQLAQLYRFEFLQGHRTRPRYHCLSTDRVEAIGRP